MAKILVIDDELSMCKVMGMFLERAGHVVTTCTDGALAIRSILDQMPDLVILDLCMPYIDGFDMLKALKGDPITQEIPVIIISSLTDIESLGRVIKLGGDDFIHKPIRGERLLESVERVLKRRAVQPPG